MHFLTIVALPPGTSDIYEGVAELMAPYNEELQIEQYTDEHDGDTYWHNPRSFWDWWQIGGRWSGHFADDYQPEKDPRNWRICPNCGGTGVRPSSGLRDGKPWCNGCTHDLPFGCPKGVHVVWPTEWVDDVGNVARLGDVRKKIEDRLPYYMVAGEAVAHKERYNPDAPDGERFQPTGEVEELLATLSDDCIVVAVDTHN